MPLVQFIDFDERNDERGSLVAIEAEATVPFAIRRVYYLYRLKSDQPRGFHAHRDLHQVYICVSGSCIVRLDDGREAEETVLDDPKRGLLIGPMTWREIRECSQDCVLLVLASDPFSEEDYIRDYGEFVASVRGPENG
ncbi:MAG TPA: FdtA/QdtA family cupin domain-containing protein [Allosphingosinicella sp.]|jgi:dTDP-4-dehydrorhamnose 3,5-epimerase-like enzyme